MTESTFVDSGGVKDIVPVVSVTQNGTPVSNATLTEQQTQTIKLAAIQTAVESVGVHRYPSTDFYTAIINFTGAIAGDTIRNKVTVDTNDNSVVSDIWTNMRTGLALASAPAIDTEVEYMAGTSLTYSQLIAAGLAKESQIGEVQATPTANTVLGRLKDLVTGIVLATGANWIGKVYIGDGTNSVDIVTNGADATTNNRTGLYVIAREHVFNGTTWDKARSGLATVSSVFTGFKNTLPWSVYKVTPTARTDGQGGPFISDTNGNLLVNTAVKVVKTNRSGTIATGGTAQSLAAANTARQGYQIQNNSLSDLWFNEIGSTAVLSQPSFKLAPGDYYESSSSAVSTAAISIIGSVTGQEFTAREW